MTLERTDVEKGIRRPRAAAMVLLALLPLAGCPSATQQVDNPYQDVDWDSWQTVHSGSHLHGGRSSYRSQVPYDIGLRHLAFSDYYPSAPTYPLPESFLERNPDAIGSPNAEHHSCTDHRLHFNSLGSWYSTGSGRRVETESATSPLEHSFDGLIVFDPEERPWEGIYRLDLTVEGRDGRTPEIQVTLVGGLECDRRSFEIVGVGRVESRRLRESQELWLRATAPTLHLRLEFDPRDTRIAELRLVQGTNRPWRDAFAAALDGTRVDEAGRPVEGLLYPDGGGITINHPDHRGTSSYLRMLDFDRRVLGIEVWNHHRWFGLEDAAPHLRFYDHWDTILRTGRRCFGFFVKDHQRYGRGRNVLLLPPLAELSREERERATLRAYRRGQFFGSLGAMAVDAEGNVVAPYDHSEFRFRRIALIEEKGRLVALEVEVGGHDSERRPQVQIRFITDAGMAAVVNRPGARFELPRTEADRVAVRYVRIEAFALPHTHLEGQPMRLAEVERMSVYDIARLHDRVGDPSDNHLDPAGEAPIPIADLIFSQPIRFHD